MTASEEAYHNWMKAAENHTWDNDDLWQAACDWQKERDAQIADDNQFEAWVGEAIRKQDDNK